MCYNTLLTCKANKKFVIWIGALVVHNLLCMTPSLSEPLHTPARLLRWRLRARSQPLCILSTLQPSQANDKGAAPTLSYEDVSVCKCVGGARRFPFKFRPCQLFYTGRRMGYNVGVKQNTLDGIFCRLKPFYLNFKSL